MAGDVSPVAMFFLLSVPSSILRIFGVGPVKNVSKGDKTPCRNFFYNI